MTFPNLQDQFSKSVDVAVLGLICIADHSNAVGVHVVDLSLGDECNLGTNNSRNCLLGSLSAR